MTLTLMCECGEAFRPDPMSYRACPRCGQWVKPATHKQALYAWQLGELLGVSVPEFHTPDEAARVIDDLLTLARLDPDIGECAADGCEWFVSKRRKTAAARTYCSRHRAGAVGS